MATAGRAMMLDREIGREDVQALSNADELTAFFAALGYETGARIEQSPANLGITSEAIARSIRRILRIADQEDLLQVYLFELKSVTVATTRALANAFRNLAGNYLLVLTSDYDRIDFVLVEKRAPLPQPGRSITQRQVLVRPRILTVERRRPVRVVLRVLRRLSYTESDPYAQYDKLRSAYDIAEWSDEHFNNRALFADYFLRERLPDCPEWEEDPKPAFRALRDLYDRATNRRGKAREAQVRRELIEPALRILGFLPAENKPPHDDRPIPDYLLHRENGEESPLAVCLTYPWGRFLDGKDDTRDADTPDENPGSVVVSLLEQGNAPYAVVTNGKHWRLYAARPSSRATSFYEIDLEETLALQDPADSFRYFWLLFRCEAFGRRPAVVEEAETESCFLDDLLRGSERYAKRLGDRLKDRVFEEIFPHLAAGFIEDLRGGKKPAAGDVSQEQLDDVFQATLTLLYRLLLYAESRDLLPVKELRGYHAVSLTRLKEEVGEVAGNVTAEIEGRIQKSFRSGSCALYERLNDLFGIIDRGRPDRNVPIYNGGLFHTDPDPEDASVEAVAARFLTERKISDRHLAFGLDLLARDDDDKTLERVFIDYKSLGVRQLGSIYEGLLEFRLRIAPEKMAICKGKKTELVVPYREAKRRKLKVLTDGRGKNAPERILPAGSVYLENDRRERKVSGSYYTPDYIVRYIVENTVGPVLDEHFERLRNRLREAQKTLKRERDKARALQQRIGKSDDPEREAYLKTRAIVDEVFGPKVLDPAMGSGHFLVEAVDYITDRTLDFLNAFPWNPVVQHLRETRETIQREIESQGVSIDPDRLTDVHLLKRHVLKRCIYGVDINPMAVELAKVSLWLNSFTLGAPLSFLDHHLAVGNSLVGINVAEAREAIEGGGISRDMRDGRSQFALFGSRFAGLMLATELMRHVGELSDVTADQVRESRAEFRRASDKLAPFKRILDLYTSQWLTAGARKEKRKKDRDPPAVEFLRSAQAEAYVHGSSKSPPLSGSSAKGFSPDGALEIAAERRAFHWELEFPEVFYGGDGARGRTATRNPDAGFDAVIGNPPWIRQETLQADKGVLAHVFENVFDSVADIYVYFLARGLSLLAPGRRLGMIIPNKWLRAAYGEKLRRHLAEHEQPTRLIDFGHAPIFPDADTFPCILITRRQEPAADSADLDFCEVPRERLPTLDLPTFFIRSKHPVQRRQLRPEGWSLESPAVAALLDKIRNTGVPLKEYVGREPLYGIKTGLNEAFLIDQATRDRLVAEDPNCEPIIKKFLRGRDIQRWHPQWGGEWMIALASSENRDWPWANAGKDAEKIFRQTYPLLHSHMAPLQDRLRRRQDRGRHWWELRSCDYYSRFDEPKVIYQDIAFHSWFAFDREGMLTNNTCYFLPGADLLVVAVLNSSVMWWYLSRIATHAKDEAFRLHAIFMEELPIPAVGRELAESVHADVSDVINRTATHQAHEVEFVDTLQSRFGVPRVTQKLERYWTLHSVELLAEARRAGAGPLSRAAQDELTEEHAKQVDLLRPILAEIRTREIRLQHLVFDAYGLTPEEIHLLRTTAPPRDPLLLAEQADVGGDEMDTSDEDHPSLPRVAET